MKRTISLTLVLAMLLTAMLGVISFAEDGETEAAPQLKIEMANLSFEDAVYPLFAVNYTAVYEDEATALENVKLEVYKGETLIETLSPDTSIAAPNGGTVVFKHMEIGLKNMGDIYTYKAVNGEDKNASEGVKYSILEYAIKITESADENLKDAIAKMIAVGAAAQTAFKHTGNYDLNNYDLKNKTYGIVIVGGATAETRKTIAEVDTVVTPVMDTKRFPAGAEIYSASTFEKADSVVVKKGVSRYFYFGTDIYGDKHSNISGHGGYDAALDHVSTNLDFDNATTTASTVIHDSEHIRIDSSKAQKYWGGRCLNVNQNGKTTLQNEMNSGWTAPTGSGTKNNRIWDVSSTKKGKNLTGTNYLGGGLTIASGYLKIDCLSEHEGKDAVGYNLSEMYSSELPAIPHDPSNFLRDGKFTVGFSIAKQKDVPFSADGSLCAIYSQSNQYGYIPMFTVDGNTLKHGDTVIVNLKEFEGETPTKDDFTTFYLVFDVNKNTLAVHREDGSVITVDVDLSKLKGDEKSMADWLSAYKQGFLWQFPENGGEAYINRITYMKGDIFS